MVERVKITPSQIVTRNGSNQITFDSNTQFMKAGGGQVYVDGYQGFPVASGGVYQPLTVRYDAANYVVFSTSLFGIEMNTIEGWTPRATMFTARNASTLQSSFTVERYIAKPFTTFTFDGQAAGTFRYVGLCGNIFGTKYLFVAPADFSFYYAEYPSSYLVFPYDVNAPATYLDTGAGYDGAYGAPQMCCDIFTAATPRSVSYARTP